MAGLPSLDLHFGVAVTVFRIGSIVMGTFSVHRMQCFILHYQVVAIVFFFSALLVGCNNHVKPQFSSSKSMSGGVSAGGSGPVNVAASDGPLVEKKPATLSGIEVSLLKQAQEAFRKARYTTPQHNNAYDKFHSVLLLNPDNSQARAGLQAILLRYSRLVRTALESGRVKAASAYLRQAELFYPANALLMDLKQQIHRVKASYAQRQSTLQNTAPKTPLPVHEDVGLSETELSAKSEAILDVLVDIGKRLKDSDESVLIFARSDREGRWIYKQLKQAAEGYRVRGDIRIARAPKLRILPPL